MPVSAWSPLQSRNVRSVVRRMLVVMLVLLVAALPLLNGSFGTSHDPLQSTAAQQGADEAWHDHEHAAEAAAGDGHTHVHNAGDHSHETAFLPPAAAQPGDRPGDRPTALDVVAPIPLHATRLDRPPKQTVTI